MARETFTKGTGITRRRFERLSGEDAVVGVREYVARWAADRERGGGDFGAVTIRSIEFWGHILEGAGPPPHESDSPADFAARILRLHEIAQAEISRGDADSAARWGCEVGRLEMLAAMKFGWEPDALRGVAVVAGARRGHEATHGAAEAKQARDAALRDGVADEIAQGTGKSAAVALVAERNGCHLRTVWRALSRARHS